jgi:hypothetical protein
LIQAGGKTVTPPLGKRWDTGGNIDRPVEKSNSRLNPFPAKDSTVICDSGALLLLQNTPPSECLRLFIENRILSETGRKRAA